MDAIKTPRTPEEALRLLLEQQPRQMTFERFGKVIRRRLYRWTGNTAVNFWTDEEVVEKLKEMGALDFMGYPKC